MSQTEAIPLGTHEVPEGEYTLHTSAEDREAALENVQATADDLEAAGIDCSVEYEGVHMENDVWCDGKDVHAVTITVHEDHLDV